MVRFQHHPHGSKAVWKDTCEMADGKNRSRNALAHITKVVKRIWEKPETAYADGADPK